MTKYALFLLLVFYISCSGHNNSGGAKAETKDLSASQGPKGIVRNIVQDRNGNIWIAAFDGIFRYDGRSFTNVTGKVSSAKFFAVLVDSKGILWCGSMGGGVYRYDGKSFKNFTTRDGLANNNVSCIYEDKIGNTWFGTRGGASRYDGHSFRNFKMDAGLHALPGNNDVNAMMQDKSGRFWFATNGKTYVYDGITFSVFSYQGKPFTNVRSIIEDKQGRIWLGGPDGLWRYNGSTFTNFTQAFVGYILEDQQGNIWTSAQQANSQARPLSGFNSTTPPAQGWALSRYDGKTLADQKPTVTQIAVKEGMICGILAANDGSIWFGSVDGLFRYDGHVLTQLAVRSR